MSKKVVREKLTLSVRDISEISQAIELISGLALPIETSFDLGVIRREIKDVIEVADEERKKLFREYAKKKEDKKDEYYIPLSTQEEYLAQSKALDDKEDEYELPTFELEAFKPDKDNEDDDRKKIPNGFITRMLPLIKQD